MTDKKKMLSEEELQAQLASVYASTSWRVTAPLRFAGRVAIETRRMLRNAVASPRAACRRGLIGCVRCGVRVLKGNAVSGRLLERLRDLFPAMSKRMAQRFAAPPPTMASGDAASAVRVFDPAYAWSPAICQADHFRQMLSQELKQRAQNVEGKVNAPGI